MTTVYARLQVRRDTSANWESENPILEEGEIGFATDAKAEKIGDGVTAWNDLLSRPSQEQLLAVQAAAEIAAGDAQQRLDGAVAAQGAAETARDETQALRDQTYDLKQDVASAIVYQDLASIAESKDLTMVAGCIDTFPVPLWLQMGASYYHEELNTPTRGSRRELPATRVWIAEAGAIYCYDGDDPSLPMWMVFEAGSEVSLLAPDTVLGNVAYRITSISAAGGYIAFGRVRDNGATNNLRDGGYVINFMSDTVDTYQGGGRFRFGGNIAQRNGSYPYVGIGGAGIASSNVNAVAMTVRPDAPVDPATGLQIPTIDVGTAAGTSRITHSGAVYDSAKTTAVSSLAYNERGDLVVAYFDGQVLTTPSDSITADGWTGDMLNASSVPALKGTTSKVARNARGSTSGLALIYAADGMVAHVTSSWNSGIMVGDIRGAFLASTDQTDLVASGELVTNGDFATNDGTGWTVTSTGTADFSTGQLTLTSDGTSVAAEQVVTTEVGKTYRVSLNKVSAAGITTDLYLRVGTYSSSYNLVNASAIGFLPAGVVAYYFVATTTTTYVRIMNAGSAGRYSTVDNVSVQLADEDRSVKGKGLIVNGTITRSIDTGGELAWYTPDTDLTVTLDSDISASGMVTWWEKVGGAAHLYQKDLSGGQSYVDGKPGTPPADTITFAGADMTIKAGKTLKLLRPSATICSANQAAFMWQTERTIVIGGLPCTLYGTSDAVTALAHDPVTGLLHAGTSAGRSDFDGMARVGNTTTPVAKAIAASGGMILEG